MNQILALRQERAEKWEAANAFFNEHEGTGKTMTPEQNAEYERMEAEVINLGKKIERHERARELQAEIAAPAAQLVVGKTGEGKASAGYRQAFWDSLRGLDVKNALSVGSDPDGGYLVPDEFERQLIEALQDENIMRRLGTVIQTGGGERKIPVVASKGNAAWVDEGDLIPESNDAFAQVKLGAHKAATMIKVSSELLNDSAFSVEGYIAREFARRIGVIEEEAFFVGDGDKKPMGLLTEALVGKTAASATTLSIDDLIDLYYSLRTPYRSRAAFVTNEETVKLIRKLKDNNGQYIWQASVQEGQPDRILGRPIYTSGFMPTMAAGAKAVAFGDFSYYWIADRQSRTFQRLNEVYAINGQVGFIATQRVDGRLILPEAMQVLVMGAA
ncbi:MAG: phage major capsid protein [Desulfovibrio sp.]|jgi:HK97 family phage major capsid protein|nr:phage major capsid protein [Desulfovibrio sp.]